MTETNEMFEFFGTTVSYVPYRIKRAVQSYIIEREQNKLENFI